MEQHLQSTPQQQQQLSSPAASVRRELQEQRYAELYERLLELGFSVAQVQDVLAALHGSAQQQNQHQQLSAPLRSQLEAALDWLCLHVPAAQLPRRFTGSAASQVAAGAAGVKVGC